MIKTVRVCGATMEAVDEGYTAHRRVTHVRQFKGNCLRPRTGVAIRTHQCVPLQREEMTALAGNNILSASITCPSTAGCKAGVSQRAAQQSAARSFHGHPSGIMICPGSGRPVGRRRASELPSGSAASIRITWFVSTVLTLQSGRRQSPPQIPTFYIVGDYPEVLAAVCHWLDRRTFRGRRSIGCSGSALIARGYPPVDDSPAG